MSSIVTQCYMPTETSTAGTHTLATEDHWVQRGKRWCLWVCGLQVTHQNISSEQNHLQFLTSLNENPRVKLFLNINFIVLVAVGIALFVYFTIDPFPADINPREYEYVPV